MSALICSQASLGAAAGGDQFGGVDAQPLQPAEGLGEVICRPLHYRLEDFAAAGEARRPEDHSRRVADEIGRAGRLEMGSTNSRGSAGRHLGPQPIRRCSARRLAVRGKGVAEPADQRAGLVEQEADEQPRHDVMLDVQAGGQHGVRWGMRCRRA